MTFERAAVIGTGMMGPGIALTLAMGGVSPVILSRTEEGAEKGLAAARDQAALLSQHGLIGMEEAASAQDRLRASTAFDQEIVGADIVIESAPENMAYKQELFERLDSLARPACVLASNTSGLSITAIASRCRHPERVLTTHFWNPPHLMQLVEIVLGERTDRNLAMAVRDLLARCGKVPVMVKKDTPGQLGNRLQMALVREAAHIVNEGIADAAEVDLAARAGFGLRLPAYGILEHQDVVGLDMGLGITDYIATDLYNEPKAPDNYRRMVSEGKLGAKSGQGFYEWPAGKLEMVKARRDRFVLEVLKARKDGRID